MGTGTSIARLLSLTASLTVGGLGCYGLELASGSDEPEPAKTPPPIVPEGVDPSISGGEPIDVVAEFYRDVAPILAGIDGRTGLCGPCHAVNGGIGPSFLEPKPDLLTSVLAYPYLIGDAPETSRLYTKGAHHGAPALPEPTAAIIAEWIVRFNAARSSAMRQPVPPPRIEPFVPMPGPNAIDLSVLDPRLLGQRLTFDAEIVGSADRSLELTRITVRTSSTAGVHVVHPLWVIWEGDDRAIPDPVDSFSNVDQSVPARSTEELGPGILILPHYTPNQRLNVVFEKIRSITR